MKKTFSISAARGPLQFSKLAFKAVSVSLMLTTAGCGVTYFSPEVTTRDSVTPVRVVALTPETVAAANASAYAPRSLPEVFYAAAGGGSTGAYGGLPAEPFLPNETPGEIEFRPLPDIDPGPYRIGVGDVVLLATRGSATTIEQLSGLINAQSQRQGYTVRDDGAIAIPEVGTVDIAGLTIPEAEDKLFQVLVQSQIDPSFSLEVAEFNSQKVAVGGAVERSALVPLTLNRLTLSDVIVAAGGIDARDQEFATIRIYRDGTLYQIPVEMYLSRQDLQNKTLLNGDAVYVDTTYDLDRALEFYRSRIDVISLRNSARSSALNTLNTEISMRRAALDERRSLFRSRQDLDAVERDYVYLSGEVANQSRFALPFDRQATLADVLYENGGFKTVTGDPSQIYVLRGSADPDHMGAVTAYHLDASNAANIVIATRMQMRPNDVVFIEEQPITKWGRSLQQLFPVLTRNLESAL
ncbi:polysaccharide biosynthesis/export family protein [Thetidibacter halocola]|uniref:Polysaccharide biosynthesis/export family protein n=1 Tax=Thetidibacter halocola TaxID=2827239 RepID=A0A8J8B7A2_9RHOB|nr:polysaccharide biosynthesis/export family protein [Thetidibacter halocola]MBS0123514.1 polysaccharide biosynthesis/export family protein [Thetidibacter halocola]